MNHRLRQAFETQMRAAMQCYAQNELEAAFGLLETAHVLGQRHVLPHVRTHYWMLRIGCRRRAPADVWGQALRIVLGALGSAVGVVPTGNTGGTDVGMFRRMPVDPAIRRLIE